MSEKIEVKKVIVDNKAVPVEDTKTVISFKKDTPIWAKNLFKGTVIVTTVATFIIANDPDITAKLALKIGVYLKGLDLAILLGTRAFGVAEKD